MPRILDFDDGFESSSEPDSIPVSAIEVTVTPTGNLESDNVQGALVELQEDVDTRALSSELSSAVSDLEDAIDLKADASALAAHTSATNAHGTTGSIVGTSDVQTLSNKRFSDAITVDAQASTPASPGAGDYKLYVKDSTQKLTVLNSSGVETSVGSGGGSEELLPNGDAEGGITGWDEGYFAPAARPSGAFVLGSLPNTFNISTTTTNPISGNTSFLLTKSTGNQQGLCVASEIPLTIGNRAKCLDIKVNYVVNSGTFTAGSVSVDSSLIFYTEFFDGSTWTLAEPSSFKLLSNSSTVSDIFSGTIQTPYNATKMRLIAYVAETATNAWTLKCEMSVKPSKYVYGTPGSNWASYSPVVTASSGSLTNYVFDYAEWMRDGQNAYYRLKLRFTGAPGTWNQPRFSLPTGHIPTANNPDTSLANVVLEDVGASPYEAKARIASNQIQITSLQGTNGVGQAVSNTAPFTWASTDYISVLIGPVEITGWSSSVQMSDNASTRVVSATMIRNPASVSASSAITAWNTVADDTHGMVNLTNGSFTIQVPGRYQLDLYTNTSGASALPVGPRIGGSGQNIFTNDSNTFYKSLSITFPNMTVGQVIDFATGSGTSATMGLRASLTLISGSSSIAASERIVERYTSTAGGTIGTSATLQSFATKSIDTHGLWNGSRFTAQRADFIEVTTGINFFVNQSTSQNASLMIYKNGVLYTTLGLIPGVGAGRSYSITGSDVVSVVSGDYIEIFAQSSVATIQNTGAGGNFVTFKSVTGTQ